MPMPPVTTKDKIREMLRNKTMVEKIAILESLGKEYRQKSSIRINKGQITGRVDEDRPDLIELKS
jgi:hypothetical protein